MQGKGFEPLNTGVIMIDIYSFFRKDEWQIYTQNPQIQQIAKVQLLLVFQEHFPIRFERKLLNNGNTLMRLMYPLVILSINYNNISWVE